jgi:hypothetical protein
MFSQLAITLRLLDTSPRISDSHQWARKRIWNLITRLDLLAWLVQLIILTKISTCLWYHLRGRTRGPSHRLLAAAEAVIQLTSISSHIQQASTLNSLLATFCPALSWIRMLLITKFMEILEWIILVASPMWDPQWTSNNNTSSYPITLRGLRNPTITTPMRWGIRKAREANGVYKNRKEAFLLLKDLKSKGKWHLAVVRREERARVTRKMC